MKIKVFIGTEEAQNLPTEICKWSILRRSKAEFEFFELKDIALELKVPMHTGFSFFRFLIPEKCGFERRAIYLDADILVLTDLQELFDLDMGEKAVMSRPVYNVIGWDTSVMLLDCAKLKHWEVRKWVSLINMKMLPYKETIYGGVGAPNHNDFGSLEPYWNHWDEYDSTSKIVHFTHIATQPWKVAGHPHAALFLQELKSALDSGFITEDFVKKEIAAGHVYPTLLQDI